MGKVANTAPPQKTIKLDDERPFFLKEIRWAYVLLYAFLLIQFLIAIETRDYRERWLNVPPPPSELGATAPFLGDKSFSYYSYGVMLQNFGDLGGRTTSLKDYNYDMIGRWMVLLDKFDPQSRFVPYLAAYYFGGTQRTERLKPIIEYLAMVGRRAENGNWHWLAQAVYLARFKYNDQVLAEKLAFELARLPNKDLPEWARNFYLVIMNARGEKEAAEALLLAKLQSEGEHMTISEFNLIKSILCKQVYDRTKAAKSPVCTDN